ncbi:MAG: peptidoglycan-associated lipoprotein Pal [Oleiphilaceae bacterium]|nr:peptidoglycan-associated lipoprotein Pal [Oleiphilaceae bacterium]
MEKRNFRLLTMALTLAFLAGCGTTGSVDDEGADARDGQASGEQDQRSEGGRTFGAGSGDGIRDEDLSPEEREAREARRQAEEAEALRSERVIYFDFDSAEIKRESRPVLEAHAAYLSENGSREAVLEGHTDQRGTKEYNLALGERRAEAVKQFLVINGVSRSQVETVSYGEEKPAAEGDSEEAYSENRRVEINYN